MSLAVFFSKLRGGWRTFVVSIAIATALGVALYFAIPSKWEAEGYIRLGQVAGQPIESSAAAMSRLTSYASLKAAMAGEVKDGDDLRKIRSDIQIQKIDDRIISVKVRALKSEVAVSRLKALCEELARHHRDISKVTESSLSDLSSDLTAGQLKYEEIYRKNGSRQDGAMLGSKIVALDGKILELRALLRPPSTEETIMQGSIYVTDRPVSPRLLLIVLLCVLVGVATALVYIFSEERD